MDFRGQAKGLAIVAGSSLWAVSSTSVKRLPITALRIAVSNGGSCPNWVVAIAGAGTDVGVLEFERRILTSVARISVIVPSSLLFPSSESRTISADSAREARNNRKNMKNWN